MATLVEVNETLKRVDDNTENTSKGIDSFVKYLQDNRRRELENVREQKKIVTEDTKTKVADATSRGGKGGRGLFDGIRNVMAGATLARLAPMLGKGLLKRVLGPAAIAVFAEDIVEFLLPDGFENEAIKNALTGGVQGAAIGFAVGGPLGAAIGAGLGVLFKNEKFKTAVGELTTTIKEQAKVLYDKIEPTLKKFKDSIVGLFDAFGITKEGVVEGLAGALTAIGDTAAKGITQLTRLIKGEFDKDSILGGITTIATVAFLLGPGKFLSVLVGLAKILRSPAGKALLLLKKGGGKILAPLLGLLGLGAVSDTPEAGGKPTPKAKPGSVVRSASGNLMIAGADGKPTTVKAPPGAKVGDIPKPKVPSKFGRFMKFLKIPGIAQIMAATDAFMILSSDMPMKEKVKRLGGIFGGLLGSGLGLKIGGAIGLIGGPPGAALGALIGTMGGYFAGDYLGNKLASFLLGGSEAEAVKPAGSDSMRMGRGGPTQTFTKPSSTGAVTMKSNISGGGKPDAIVGGTNINNIDNSSRTNINNNTGTVIGQGNITDMQDQFLVYI